jgi:hypothetical protein
MKIFCTAFCRSKSTFMLFEKKFTCLNATS